MIETKFVIVGSGIFGIVVAERISSVLQEPVTIIERRNAIGGNCRSETDPETGIECHCYGSHIFHTSNRRVWDYLSQFSEFTNYRHKVLLISDNHPYFMPINLKTICDVYGRNITPEEAAALLSAAGSGADQVDNLEAKALSLIGEELYAKLIRKYTRKQWNQDPRELPAGIIARLPIRTNFNTDYFDDPYQGLPREGYSALLKTMLDNPRITILLNTDFNTVRSQIRSDAMVIYTGMIDEFFDYRLGELAWRSLRFDWETLAVQDYQGTAVVNYADAELPYTRIHEFKHFHPERVGPYQQKKTIICREYPRDWARGREACYPVNTPRSRRLLREYQLLAEPHRNLVFGGRLGCYQYWDMDQAVLHALECFEQIRNRVNHHGT